MQNTPSSPHVRAANVGGPLTPEGASDEALLRGFVLSLGASGRREKTLATYEKSVLALSGFARGLGFPGLAEMDHTTVQHWLMSMHQRGIKAATLSVRYRSLNRFIKWCVLEGEREVNPLDRIDPPRIPDEIQPHYTRRDVQPVLKAAGKEQTLHSLRDKAIILTLYDTGVRGAELTGMKVEGIDWRERRC